MRKLHETSKAIQKSNKESYYNTRRIQKNLPLIERKLDVISGESTFRMKIPITNKQHSAFLNMKFKPDNCCECLINKTTGDKQAVAYHSGFGSGYDTHQAVYIEPLALTGTTFNYGVDPLNPFFTATYQEYNSIIEAADYSLGPDGVIIPIDGIYTINFRNTVSGQAASAASSITATIRRNNNDILSSKNFSVRKGNLPLGTFNIAVNMYSLCVPLLAGDTIAAWWATTDIVDWAPEGGINPFFEDSLKNATRINLVGLGTGMLIGFVRDVYGAPISGATVSYSMGFGDSVVTDIYGAYAFYEVVPGTYSVTASAGGFVSSTRDVTVNMHRISNLDFELIHI